MLIRPMRMRANTLMNLIDVASWQRGIDLSAVFAQNPLHGVIVKATQGTTYINPDYSSWAKWLNDNDKPFGLYHYCDGGDAEKEASFFYNAIRQYVGKAIPVADYEGEALSKGTAWLKRFLDRFYALSGVRAMIYCSLSVIHEQDFTGLTEHPLWIAQYADMATVNGFLDHPWQSGSVSPFSSYVMHQYTSCGRLKGYDGNLDFDQFNGSYSYWLELARGEADQSPVPAPTPTLKPADPQIVLSVLKNEYGTGENRVNALRDAGYDPDSVQRKVNELYGIAAKVKRDISAEMPYINSILWIARS